MTIAALILGKSVLYANLLPFYHPVPEKPLIWNVSWKTAIYTLVALVVHYLEHLYDYWKEAPGLVAANHKLLAEFSWPHFWAIQILLVTLIVNYCGYRRTGPRNRPRQAQGDVLRSHAHEADGAGCWLGRSSPIQGSHRAGANPRVSRHPRFRSPSC